LAIVFYLYTFIVATIEFLVCFTTCSWYFTRKKESAYMKPWLIIKEALKFHIGTVAKFTLFKFFLTVPKLVIGNWRSFLRRMKQEKNSVRFMISITMPFLTWHNKVLKYISKDIFVMTTMWGDEYVKASQKAFFVSTYRHK
jgi:hypothetical protein